MNELVKILERKISPKYLIYLDNNNFKVYKDINKTPITISIKLLKKKLYEVIDTCVIDGETLYLVGADNIEIGWISIKNPLRILNSFNNLVSPIMTIEDSVLNEHLGIKTTLKKGRFYKSKYISLYNEKVYLGVENNDEFLGFFLLENLSLGEVEENEFIFNNPTEELFTDYQTTNSKTVFVSNAKYSTLKYFKELNLGTVKVGKDVFWFKGEQTNIDPNIIESKDKDYDEYYLEHLIQSIKLQEKINRTNNKTIDQNYVNKMQEQVIELKESKAKYLYTNRMLSKELKQSNLDLKRKKQKLDYSERLSNNQQKKIDYYQERNIKLEKRIELLESKLDVVNKKYKELKNSKLIKIQSKFSRK